LPDAIGYLDGLCRYSLWNCRICHLGQLDIFLLEIIQNFGKSFNFRGIEFEHDFKDDFLFSVGLPLFNLIATYCCSPQVVAKYFRLVIPSKAGKYPALAEPIFASLSRLLSSISRTPTALYEFSEDSPPLCFGEIGVKDIRNGFSFIGWILLDVPVAQSASSQPVVFSVRAAQDRSIVCFLTGSSLCVQFLGELGVFSVLLTSSLSTGTWHCLSLTFKPIDANAQMLVTLDSNPTMLYIVKNPYFLECNIQIDIGGFIQTVPVREVYCWLGPIKFLTGVMNSPDDFSPFIRSDRDIPIDDCQLPCLMKRGKVHTFRSLLTVVQEYSFIDYLTPFFMYSDAAPTHFLESMIDFLNLIGHHINYKIIGRLLRKWERETLTYSIYLRFFELLNSCNSVSLLFDVVFDFAIWSRALDPHRMKIACHWCQTLLPAHARIIVSGISFADLLARIVFYFAGKTDSIDCEGISLFKQMTLIALAYRHLHPSPSDAQHLLSHIDMRGPIPDSISFLQLLRDIGSPDDVDFLRHFFRFSDPDLFSETLATVLSLAPSRRHEQIKIVMAQISNKHITRSMIDRFVALVQVFPIVILLVAMISFFRDDGPDTFISILNCVPMSTSALQSIVSVKDWYIWLVLVTLRLDAERQSAGIILIHSICRVDSTFASRDVILCLVDAIDRFGLLSGRHFAQRFMKLVCDIDFALIGLADGGLFVQHCFQLIFFPNHCSDNLLVFFLMLLIMAIMTIRMN
jgi:hypothetical protein